MADGDDKLSPAISLIKRLLGITEKDALSLMPGGDDGKHGYPGILMTPVDDDEPWGVREHRKDVEEFYKGQRR